MNPVDDFLKTAGWWDTLKGGFGQALPGAVIGAGLAAGGQLASAGFGLAKDKLTKPRDYKAMLEATPSLNKFDAGQVQMVFNSLRSHAPTMSKDPLIAGSFIRRTLELSPETGPFIDPATVKMLAETQRNVATARSDRGPIVEAFKPTQIAPIDMDPFAERGMKEEALGLQRLEMKQRGKQFATESAQRAAQQAQQDAMRARELAQRGRQFGAQQRLRQKEYALKEEKHPLEMAKLRNMPQTILQRGQGIR